ncbi:hypothetical protein [Ekhidna sp.]
MKLFLSFVIILYFSDFSNAQSGVGIGTQRPDPSAVLEIADADQSKGLLIPTTNNLGRIVDAADGLIVYNSVTKKFHYRDSVAGEWLTLVTNKQLDTKIDIGGNSDASFSKIKIKVIEIGDWDMDATERIFIPHDIIGAYKIKSVTAAIRFDGDIGELEDLTGAGRVSWFDGVNASIDPNIVLIRNEGGIFDDTFYDNVPYNRGWLTIIYEDE